MTDAMDTAHMLWYAAQQSRGHEHARGWEADAGDRSMSGRDGRGPDGQLRRRLSAAGGLSRADQHAAQDLKIGLASEPSSIDPHYHNLTPNNGTLSHVFERLVETAPNNKLVPGLAMSWKALDDNDLGNQTAPRTSNGTTARRSRPTM